MSDPPAFRALKVVSFDLDNTFWDCDEAMGSTVAALHDWLEEHHPEIASKFDSWTLDRLVFTLRKERPDIAHDFSKLRALALETAARECGIDPAEVVEPAMAVFRAARNRVRLFDGVTELLDRLRRRGVKVATITNGNAQAHQIPGIAEHVDLAVCPTLAGAAKPDPAPFERVRAHFDVAPWDVCHVGDDLVTDVTGAKNVGFWSIWIDYAAYCARLKDTSKEGGKGEGGGGAGGGGGGGEEKGEEGEEGGAKEDDGDFGFSPAVIRADWAKAQRARDDDARKVEDGGAGEKDYHGWVKDVRWVEQVLERIDEELVRVHEGSV